MAKQRKQPKAPSIVTTSIGTVTAVVPRPSPGSAARATDGGEPVAGRRAQAARNDLTILEAARTVFLADPKAPVSAVAKQAAVGISAIYRRWPGKEDLLRQLCSDGLERFVAEAEVAETDPDGWSALTGFLRRIVAADVHSLTVHLAGTFAPTPDMFVTATRATALTEALVRRAARSGKLRPDADVQDLTQVLEGCAAIRVPDAERTALLRQRYLALLIDGLAATKAEALPGPPPTEDEANWRWRQPRR